MRTLDPDLVLVEAFTDDKKIELHARKGTSEEACPYCGKKSRNVHSVYRNTISDLPVQEKLLTIILERRVFFCKNPECDHARFPETLPFTTRYGRRTIRLDEKIREIALNMSARSAKKVINKGIARISDDTILRILKKQVSCKH
ncbi:transposase family protein [Kosmotoga olearia]|uniref:transposase family protein n=1 Tax=Kosmotoga olearia TaxID=651457 RepID=UPI00018496C2|nr:transposase family protein [Kosmotoga olearia]